MPDEKENRYYDLLKQHEKLLRSIHIIPCFFGFHGSNYGYLLNSPPFKCEYCGNQNKKAMKKWKKSWISKKFLLDSIEEPFIFTDKKGTEYFCIQNKNGATDADRDRFLCYKFIDNCDIQQNYMNRIPNIVFSRKDLIKKIYELDYMKR